MNQDNSQSWDRISCGPIKHVVESIQDNTEILADPQEEQVPQTNIKVVAARSKVKKQNLNREYSLVQQQPHQCTKEDGLTLSPQNKILPRMIIRKSDQSSSTL